MKVSEVCKLANKEFRKNMCTPFDPSRYGITEVCKLFFFCLMISGTHHLSCWFRKSWKL